MQSYLDWKSKAFWSGMSVPEMRAQYRMHVHFATRGRNGPAYKFHIFPPHWLVTFTYSSTLIDYSLESRKEHRTKEQKNHHGKSLLTVHYFLLQWFMDNNYLITNMKEMNSSLEYVLEPLSNNLIFSSKDSEVCRQKRVLIESICIQGWKFTLYSICIQKYVIMFFQSAY